MEPHQSAELNPENSKEYPEILLTGNRQVEYINAQMHDGCAIYKKYLMQKWK